MNYTRNIRKKKVTLDKIVPNLNNAGTSNWDMESVKENLKEMQTKDIINEHYKPLITLPSDSPDFFIIQVDVCITPGVNYDVIWIHLSGPAIATPNTGSFVTPCTPQTFHWNSVISSSFSSKLDLPEAKVCGKIMAMKSFFMDELHAIKNESLKSEKMRNSSTNDDHGTVESLQNKIKLLETKNKLLKDYVKNKQKLISKLTQK